MNRGVFAFAIGATIWLTGAPTARAVVLNNLTGDSRNTSTTGLTSAEIDAWNLQATYQVNDGGVMRNMLATPISGQYFLMAKHIANGYRDKGYFDTITLGSTTYNIVKATDGYPLVYSDPGSDLAIGKITGTFSNWAPLYKASRDGSELNRTMTVFGDGGARGTAVTVGGDTRGWQWTNTDRQKAWGKNVVSAIDSYSGSSPNSLLVSTFCDPSGPYSVPNESGLSWGDSSGAIFVQANDGQLKLAGINFAQENAIWNSTPSDSGAYYANIFDGRGLYVNNGAGWQYVDPAGASTAPTLSYSSRVSERLDWIYSIAPVPEPSTIAMMIAAPATLGALWWMRRAVRRRRCRRT